MLYCFSVGSNRTSPPFVRSPRSFTADQPVLAFRDTLRASKRDASEPVSTSAMLVVAGSGVRVPISLAFRMTPSPAISSTADPFRFGACVLPSIRTLCGGYAAPYHSCAGSSIEAQSIGAQCRQSELPSWKQGAPLRTMSELSRMSAT